MILTKDEQCGVYCDNCGMIVKDTLLFLFDNSSNEYGCITICEHCLAKAKTEFFHETKGTFGCMNAMKDDEGSQTGRAQR